MTDVLCAGHVNWDVTLRVDRLPEPDGEVSLQSTRQAGGGSAANVAVNLAGLSVTPTLFGSIGTDETGTRCRQELADSGVYPHLVRADGDTAVKYLVVDGDGEVMVLSGAGHNEAYTPRDLPDGALATDVVHLTNQDPAVAAGLAEGGRDRDATISLAPGRRLADRDFSAALRLADLVFVNDREATALGEAPWGDTVRPDATVVVTLGSEGAEVRRRSETIHHPGFDVEPLDTTGAGDAFAAGFLAAREGALADTALTDVLPGLAPESDGDAPRDEAALAVANACGAVASRALGARATLDPATLRDVIAGQ
ncbi:carbohydrate kinase family protein [Halobaculum sp. MBLA0147]|uniref:carbohydrate kinase family protein n=1 Tax=Halobaculum sp. MBLA0147 TaxID=3079934 RepID=UPI00352412CF